MLTQYLAKHNVSSQVTEGEITLIYFQHKAAAKLFQLCFKSLMWKKKLLL